MLKVKWSLAHAHVRDLTDALARQKVTAALWLGVATTALVCTSPAKAAAPEPNAADIPSPPARTSAPVSSETATMPLPPPSPGTTKAPSEQKTAQPAAPAPTPAAAPAPPPVVNPAPATGAPQPPPAAPHALAPYQSPFATRGELQAVQAQLKALQERSVPAPTTGPSNAAASSPPPTQTPPVASAATPEVAPDEQTVALQRRVAALEAQLKTLEQASNAPQPVQTPVTPANPTPAAEDAHSDEANKDDGTLEDTPHIGLLPLEFAAFGDFYYAITEPGADDFNIGAVEIDPTFHVSPYIHVAAAIAYSGSDQSFSLPAFVVDCSLYGDGEDYPLQSKYITRSGVSFGRFDVPFGIAYLEYPSVSNRLMNVANAVNATHGSWNDLGVQGYAEAETWTAILYVVNGSQFEGTLLDTTKPRVGVGGRVGAKIQNVVELGGSHAELFGFDGPLSFSGGDLTSTIGRVDLRGEYLVRHQPSDAALDHTHGAYGRAVIDFAPYFLVGRYDTVFTARNLVDRRLAAGAAVEVFPQGEVRVIYEQSLNTDGRTVWFQLVGGSNFQPTGLRR